MRRLGPLSLTLLGVLVVAGACTTRDATPRSSKTVAPSSGVDSLTALIRSHYGARPMIGVRERARVLIEFSPAPWTNVPGASERDSAFAVARLVWDNYGATHGIDTISVSNEITFQSTKTYGPTRPDSAKKAEYIFYRKEFQAQSAPVTLLSEP
jgi:hypothetical protein